MKHSPQIIRRGFTLIELVSVIAILSLVAVFAATRLGDFTERARIAAAEREMKAVASAFTDPDGGYLADMRGIPGFSVGYLRIANLLIPTNLYGRAEGALTGERVDVDLGRGRGVAKAAEFVSWSDEKRRGWHGPYLREAAGEFPAEAAARPGFYPELSGLLLPADFLNRKDGGSVYGFPGEPAVNDPWGNPYVLQIPPPQAFPGASTNIAEETRFRYARIVSAGPDGILETPCFSRNSTNHYATSWNERTRRLSRQAGLIDRDDRSARGDDLVEFLLRNDIDEGETE